MLKVLITGGKGLVGTHLSQALAAEGFEVSHLSRSVTGNEAYSTYKWDVARKEVDESALNVDYIIHLAGSNVAEGKWTIQRKKVIYDSRIDSTQLLYDKVVANKIALKGFLMASAVGYYGLDTGDQWMSEGADPGSGFLAEVVRDWEERAQQFEEKDIPTTLFRIGVVLAKESGALPKLTQPIRYGAGAPLGSGRQYMSWVHIGDLVNMFIWALKNQKTGIYNAVAPQPIDNIMMTRQIAETLRKPLMLPKVPAFVLRMVLGEMSGIVLGGNRVSCQRLKEAGFSFQYEKIDAALQDLLD